MFRFIFVGKAGNPEVCVVKSISLISLTDPLSSDFEIKSPTVLSSLKTFCSNSIE